jgi:hypothetical protein
MDYLVLLDVSGTVYKVPKTLLEAHRNTMLARLVSERWRKDNENNEEEAIFINRNGDRFQYILDYMRDEEVHLPINVSKDAIVKDLDYFGFEDVNMNKIHGGRTIAEAAARIAECKKCYEEEIKEFDNAVKLLEKKKLYSMIAYECFEKYANHGSLSDIRVNCNAPFKALLGDKNIFFDPELSNQVFSGGVKKLKRIC